MNAKKGEDMEYKWTCPICEDLGIADTKMGLGISSALHFKNHHKRHDPKKAKTKDIVIKRRSSRGRGGASAECLWVCRCPKSTAPP